MSAKPNRKLALETIIRTRKVGTQEELARLLTEEGFSVTQATLSRDIKELGAYKVADVSGNVYYRISAENARKQHLDNTTIEISGQMCLVHSRPGFAPAIAAMIDHAMVEGVMGTIAGDDTVLVILRQEADKKETERALSSIIQ